MENKIKHSKINLLIIISTILVLLSILAIAFLPILSGLKYKIEGKFNDLTSNGVKKNFSGVSGIVESTEKAEKISKLCNNGVKYKAENFKESKVLDTIFEGNFSTSIELNNSIEVNEQFKLTCIEYNKFSDQIRNSLVASWNNEGAVEKVYNMTLENVKKLSTVDFYQKYLLASNNSCIAKTGLNQLPFTAKSITSSMKDEYLICDMTKLDQKIFDYYIFPKDDKKSVMQLRYSFLDLNKYPILVF